MERAPGTPLTRQVIVEAAVRQMDDDGLDRVTTRRLASELGVSPMALYRHIESKDDVLEAVIDALLRRTPIPTAQDWPDVMRSLAVGLRTMFVDHPAALELFLRRPVTSPTARHRLQVALDALAEAGFEEDDACRAYAAVHSYTLGFSALEAARTRHRSAARTGARVEDDPLVTTIQSFVSEGQFEHGLDALLAGLSPSGPPLPS